jgi:hypothetical protein
MKLSILILSATILFAACENTSSSEQTGDTTIINTKTGNVSDGGPNHGIGDTNSYDRMNDKIPDTSRQSDTIPRK